MDLERTDDGDFVVRPEFDDELQGACGDCIFYLAWLSKEKVRNKNNAGSLHTSPTDKTS